MKKVTVATILAVLLYVPIGSISAAGDGTPLPLCWPDPCPRN
ncbi:MAG TPA: hypothetical protein VG649_08690 [Candidatus Angelobacter sp.]|jgi:hypothetical protein|nr:hypothetical protein [Candidatus Angelobacter sp.]